jgi:hypothetical protein
MYTVKDAGGVAYSLGAARPIVAVRCPLGLAEMYRMGIFLDGISTLDGSRRVSKIERKYFVPEPNARAAVSRALPAAQPCGSNMGEADLMNDGSWSAHPPQEVKPV